jgi:hypothetical protein
MATALLETTPKEIGSRSQEDRELCYDHHQFERRNKPSATLLRMFGIEDVRRMGIIRRKQTSKHRKPEWLNSWEETAAHLSRKLYGSPLGADRREMYSRWCNVIFLYWINGWTAKDVGKELYLTEAAVKSIVYRLTH